MIKIPAKLYIAMMLIAGVVTFFYGIGTGDAKTILGSFVFIGIAGGVYLLHSRRSSVPSVSPAGPETKKVQISSGNDNTAPAPPIADQPHKGSSPKVPAQEKNSLDGSPPIPAHLIGDELAGVISGFFSTDLYFSVFVSAARIEERFPTGWTRDAALSRWYSLGLICLTHCSIMTRWTDALSIQGGMDVHDATIRALWDRWRLTDNMQAKVRQFMQSNIKDITSSLRTIVNRQAQDRWFTHYAWRILYGVNAQWSISQMDIKNPPLCDTFDLEFGESLRTVFKEASSSILEMIDTHVNWESVPRSRNSDSDSIAGETERTPDFRTNNRMHEQRSSESYPSPERVKELWNAWERSGEAGLLEFFKDQQKPSSSRQD